MTDSLPIRVLLIDDEQSVLLSLAGFLEDCDFDVFLASDASQALKVLETERCDVAIVDIRLPGINGDDLIVQIHQANPSMKFLIYTGSVNFEISSAIENLGIRPGHVFYKPLEDMNLLIDAINMTCS